MTRQTIRFHELYQQYAADVYRFSFWLAGNAADADDITADTFLRAWTARGEIRTETVKAYLFAIARNIYLKMVRQARREVRLEAAAAVSTPGPVKQVADRLALEKAVAHLQTLPETDRAALLLRVQHDLPYAEIARVLQISVSAAKVKVHRARLRLAALRTLDEELRHGI